VAPTPRRAAPDEPQRTGRRAKGWGQWSWRIGLSLGLGVIILGSVGLILVFVFKPGREPEAPLTRLPEIRPAGSRQPAPVVATIAPPPPPPKAALAPLPRPELGPALQPTDVPPVVVLQPAAVPADILQELRANPHYGILVRELVRQAFLIAAREELGLPTRDGTLRETVPADWAAAAVELTLTAPADTPAQVTLRRGPAHQLLATQLLPLPKRTAFVEYTQLLEQVELLSRDHFCVVLRQAGWQGTPNRKQPAAQVPEATEQRLAQLSCTAQFAAVRDLHAALRAAGESPELLGALVRGYAHLGLLTDFHWHAWHKAFKARALVYAQRLVVRDPQSPWGLWHRAYAYALAGLHQAALADLAAAAQRWDERRAANADAAEPLRRPGWVELLDASCRFDAPQLTAVAAAEPLRQLALLLRFVVAQEAPSRGDVVETGRLVLQANPACYRIYDGLCASGGLGNLHVATVQGLAAFRAQLPEQLRELPQLPAPVARLLPHAEPQDPVGTEQQVIHALLAAGQTTADVDELSWSVLGRLLHDIRFTQVWWRLDFMQNQWGVPVEDFLAEALPLVAEHPYQAVIASFGRGRRPDPQTYAAVRARPEIADLELTAMPFLFRVQPLDREGGAPLLSLAVHNQDDIYGDLLRLSGIQDREHFVAQQLEVISPHSPFGLGARLRTDWRLQRHDNPELEQRFAQARPGLLAEWEQQHGHHGAVLRALGQHYVAQGQLAAAQRCYQRYLKQWPDAWAYQALAKTYQAQGRMDQWQATLDAYLQQQDDGLDHARVQVEIATHFMRQRDWAKAQPYAEAAAQTWAAWAMQCAYECYSGLREWDRAELWVRRLSERYANGRLEWYIWCRWTGRGAVEQARQLAADYVRTAADRLPVAELPAVAVFFLLLKQPQGALGILQTLYPFIRDATRLDDGCDELLLALTAEELNQTAVRDATWKQLAVKETPWARLAALLHDATARGAPLDLQAVEA
jgi:tetratricopeptide (TPR) repeat protein